MRITLTLDKLIFLVFIIFFTLFFIGSVVAQETEPNQTAKRYGVTFPVVELGNCTDLASCKTYCEDPVNKDACISFAKQKGFYKEDALSTRKSVILERAKQALGCDSEESCKALCEQDTNRDKCSQFAKQNGLNGGQVEDPAKQQIIQRAKEVLGCDSETSCKDICSQESNRDKCTNFAKQVGLRGGEQRVGPGGCTSEQTCKAYCSDPNNFQVCSQFGGQSGRPGPNSQGFRGPGGCDSETSCRVYCQDHPQECRSFGERQKPTEQPRPSVTGERRPPTTEELGCKTPQECYDACKNNPGRCPGFNPNSIRPTDTRPFNSTMNNMPNTDPRGYTREQQEAECKAGGGTCTSTSPTFCGCQGYKSPTSNSTSTSTQPSSGSNYTGGMSRAEQEAACQSTGGTCGSSDPNFCGCQNPNWNSGSSAYSQAGYQSYSQATYDVQPSPSPAVQGATTQPSLFQNFWNTFFGQ